MRAIVAKIQCSVGAWQGKGFYGRVFNVDFTLWCHFFDQLFQNLLTLGKMLYDMAEHYDLEGSVGNLIQGFFRHVDFVELLHRLKVAIIIIVNRTVNPEILALGKVLLGHAGRMISAANVQVGEFLVAIFFVEFSKFEGKQHFHYIVN